MTKTLEDRRDYYRRIRSASWTCILIGLFLTLLPFLASLSVSEGRIGFVVIGAMVFVIGILSRKSFTMRIRLISDIIDAGGILTRWKDTDWGETLITRKGIFYNGDIIPIDTFNCRIEQAELKNDYLLIRYSVPRKSQRIHTILEIEVPSGFEDPVRSFIRIVDTASGLKEQAAKSLWMDPDDDDDFNNDRYE